MARASLQLLLTSQLDASNFPFLFMAGNFRAHEFDLPPIVGCIVHCGSNFGMSPLTAVIFVP